MRMKHIAAVIVVTAVLLFTQTYTSARGAEYKIPQTVDMTPVAEEPAELLFTGYLQDFASPYKIIYACMSGI